MQVADNAHMDTFEESLAQVLAARPGMNREKLAVALKADNGDEFRELLSQACDKGIVHKVQDKYYPGTRRTY
jgi:hypothetical protein